MVQWQQQPPVLPRIRRAVVVAAVVALFADGALGFLTPSGCGSCYRSSGSSVSSRATLVASPGVLTRSARAESRRGKGGGLAMKAGAGDLLPREKIINTAAHEGVDKVVAAQVLDTAEAALRNWELSGTDFLTPPECAVMEKLCAPLVDVEVKSWGGFPQAERKRLFFHRADMDMSEVQMEGVAALDVGGQFLFDMAEHRDFLGAILNTGVSRTKVGDILVQGERGAQIIVHPELAEFFSTALQSVRSISVKVSAIPLAELKVRAQVLKSISSVESSLRLDAIASAGMSVSRSKMADAVKKGGVLVNWKEVTNTSATVREGDMITVRGKGRVEVESIVLTKKGKWKVQMQRTT